MSKKSQGFALPLVILVVFVGLLTVFITSKYGVYLYTRAEIFIKDFKTPKMLGIRPTYIENPCKKGDYIRDWGKPITQCGTTVYIDDQPGRSTAYYSVNYPLGSLVEVTSAPMGRKIITTNKDIYNYAMYFIEDFIPYDFYSYLANKPEGQEIIDKSEKVISKSIDYSTNLFRETVITESTLKEKYTTTIRAGACRLPTKGSCIVVERKLSDSPNLFLDTRIVYLADSEDTSCKYSREPYTFGKNNEKVYWAGYPRYYIVLQENECLTAKVPEAYLFENSEWIYTVDNKAIANISRIVRHSDNTPLEEIYTAPLVLTEATKKASIGFEYESIIPVVEEFLSKEIITSNKDKVLKVSTKNSETGMKYTYLFLKGIENSDYDKYNNEKVVVAKYESQYSNYEKNVIRILTGEVFVK